MTPSRALSVLIVAVASALAVGCDVPGESLCGLVIDQPGTVHLTATSDAICPAAGIFVDGSTASGDITVVIDLDGHTIETTSGTPLLVDLPADAANPGIDLKVEIANGMIRSEDARVTTVGAELILSNMHFDRTPIRAISGPVAINDSTLLDGGVRASNPDAVVTATQSTFDNTPLRVDSGAHLVLYDSNVVNVAYGAAVRGTLEMLGGSLNNNYSAFTADSDGTSSLAGVEIHGNGFGISAGIDETVSVAWSSFRDNESAMFVGGVGSSLSVSDSVVADNAETAIVVGNGGHLTLDNVSVTGNGFGDDATGQFDAITSFHGSGFATLTLLDSTITDNAGLGLAVDARFYDPWALITITNTVIADNGFPGCGDYTC